MVKDISCLEDKKLVCEEMIVNLDKESIDYDGYFVNLSRNLIILLIDRIEIDEKRNIEVYYKFNGV